MVIHGNHFMNSTTTTCYTQLPSMFFFLHTFSSMNNTSSHITTSSLFTHSFSSFSQKKHKIQKTLLTQVFSPCPMEVVEILPSNQYSLHPSWTNEDWEWLAFQWNLGWEFLCPLDWEVLYIIGKLLEHGCLRWACMTLLGT
jgi:hypothetical protein